MRYVIGSDLGTQGTKTVIYDETGKAVCETFEASNIIRSGNSIEQSPEEMLGSVLRTVKLAVEQRGIAPGDIAALGLDGQMAGIIGIDLTGSAITPYDSWLDRRCAKYFDMLRGYGEENYIAIGGSPVTYSHAPKMLWWKYERPHIFEDIYKFVQPAVYCVMQLCGMDADEAYIDHTYLHFAGFASVEKKEWSTELLDFFGIPLAKLPRIIKPWNIVGHLTREMAERCGLQAGMPIVAGCGDTAASAFGAGITHSGMMYDVGGTASTLAIAADSFAPDTEKKILMFPAAVVEGLYTPLAYMNGAGMCLPWFKNDVLGRDSYDSLNSLVTQIQPGSEGLLFVPHFSGRVCPNSAQLRGSWLNLGWQHSTAHMYRSIMESIAYEYKIYLNRIKELLPYLDLSYVLSVGGAAKSAEFLSIKADVLGMEVKTINRSDTATLACAIIAGYGTSLFPDLCETVHRFIEYRDTTAPRTENHAKYAVYAKAYERTLEYMEHYYTEINEILN